MQGYGQVARPHIDPEPVPRPPAAPEQPVPEGGVTHHQAAIAPGHQLAGYEAVCGDQLGPGQLRLQADRVEDGVKAGEAQGPQRGQADREQGGDWVIGLARAEHQGEG